MRIFYKCIICGQIQEDAIEANFPCEECDAFDWEFDHEEED